MKRNSAGFTLIELLVVIAIIAILAAILFPVFTVAKERARQATCAAHIKELGSVLFAYAQDHDNRLPFWKKPEAPGSTVYPRIFYWTLMVQPYIKNYKVFYCMDRPKQKYWHEAGGLSDYGLNILLTENTDTVNARGVMLDQPRKPSKTVMLADGVQDDYGNITNQDIHLSPPGLQICGWARRPVFRHDGKVNVTWVDGHVTAEKNGSAFYPTRRVEKSNGLWDLQ